MEHIKNNSGDENEGEGLNDAIELVKNVNDGGILTVEDKSILMFSEDNTVLVAARFIPQWKTATTTVLLVTFP